MAHTLGTVTARAQSLSNPITVSVTVLPGETVLGVLMEVGSTNSRTGGSLTWGHWTLTQANSTQKAAASPEASAELWYLENPSPGTRTLTIPNAGALNVFYVVVRGRSGTGRSQFDGAAGNNGTSANPAPGAIVTTTDGCFVLAVVGTGAQTWNPSAQAGTGIGGTGTSLGNFDDGAFGGGFQYNLQATRGSLDLNWTFGTSDDWGAVSAAFRETGSLNLENYMAAKSESAGVISVGERIR